MVEVTTLTRALEEYKVERVDFLKIDTEGHDLFVLRGFPWKSFQPEVIVCEFEDNKTVELGYRFDDIASFLSSKGYRVLVSEWHPITAYGANHRWRRIRPHPCELADSNAWGNLIALKKPADFDAALALAKSWESGT